MKTAELTGTDLDYWVAKADGFKIQRLHRSEYCDFDGLCVIREGHMPSEIGSHYSPSKWWSDGGRIIEREKITLIYSVLDGEWYADLNGPHHPTMSGPTPLVAAMRAYVASKFGDEVRKEPQSGISSDSPPAK